MQHDVKSAIAVFDKSAERTRPNAQTEAWKVLRDEIERLRDIEAAAALLAVERAEFGIRARKAEAALQAQQGAEPVAVVLAHRLHQPNHSGDWISGDFTREDDSKWPRGWSVERAYRLPAAGAPR